MLARLLLFAIATSHLLVCGLPKDEKASSTCSSDEFFHAGGENSRNLSCQETSQNSSKENAPKSVASMGSTNFSWYAIKLSSKKWGILRKGDKFTGPFEKNIEKYCKGDQFFGFSFIAVQSKYEFAGASAEDSRRQVLLADVFYTCWTNNSSLRKKTEISGNESDVVIFRYLAKKMLLFVPEIQNEEFYSESLHSAKRDYCINPNGKYEAKPHGVEACFFYLDANSIGVVYGGAMTFNKIDLTGQSIDRVDDKVDWLSLYESRKLCTNPDDDASSEGLKDGECLRYLSDQDFFLFCCCYRKPELCSFDRKYLKMIKKNLKEWKYDPIEMREFDGRVFTRWTFRHFMHSDVAEHSKRADHIVRIHCAKGGYTITDPGSSLVSRNLTNERLLRSTYDKSGGISRFCLKKFTIDFPRSDFNVPERITVSYEADVAGECREEGCSITSYRKCLNNLIRLNQSVAFIQCCCKGGDLCNHRGIHEHDISTSMFTCSSVSKSIMHKLLSSEDSERIVCTRTFVYGQKREMFLINGSSYYAPFSNRRGEYALYEGCYRQEGFPLTNLECNKRFRFVTFQFVKCECTTYYSPSGEKYVSLSDAQAKCDRKFSRFESLPQHEISKVPQCYHGRIALTNGTEDGSSFSVIDTTDTPICVDEFVFTRRGSIAYASMPLSQYISSQNYLSKMATGELKRFNIFSTNDQIVMTFLCQSNMTEICNGPENFHNHLLPEFFTWVCAEAEAPLKPDARTCEVTPDSLDSVKEVVCDRNEGCFSLRSSVSGNTTGGCMSDISSRISWETIPAVALLCSDMNDTDIICVVVDDTTGFSSLEPDILCCCKHGYHCIRDNFVDHEALNNLHK